jgi:hypothetical protein
MKNSRKSICQIDSPRRDGLWPIHPVPEEAFAGLTREQAKFLAVACKGMHVIAQGPGGSGKTTVMARYAKLRAEADENRAVVWCISPDPNTALKDVVKTRPPSAGHITLAEAKSAKQEGKKTCLLVDEHSSIGTSATEWIGTFDQVIIAGDDGQGTHGIGSRSVNDMWPTSRAIRLGTETLWRACNKQLFNILSATIQQGRTEAMGSSSAEADETARIGTARRGLAAKWLTAGLRSLRHGIANDGSRTLIVVNNQKEAVVAASVTALAQPAMRPHQTMAHTAALQGTESDITIHTTPWDQAPPSSRKAENIALIALGRPRFRIEILKTEGDKSNLALLRALLNWAIEPDERIKALAGLRRTLPDNYRLLPGTKHIEIETRTTGEGIACINLIGSDPRDQLSSESALKRRGWWMFKAYPEEISGQIRLGPDRLTNSIASGRPEPRNSGIKRSAPAVRENT